MRAGRGWESSQEGREDWVPSIRVRWGWESYPDGREGSGGPHEGSGVVRRDGRVRRPPWRAVRIGSHSCRGGQG